MSDQDGRQVPSLPLPSPEDAEAWKTYRQVQCLIMVAAVEAVVGLVIEISFIATFTQRFFGK
jgi:hypothetical protein